MKNILAKEKIDSPFLFLSAVLFYFFGKQIMNLSIDFIPLVFMSLYMLVFFIDYRKEKTFKDERDEFHEYFVTKTAYTAAEWILTAYIFFSIFVNQDLMPHPMAVITLGAMVLTRIGARIYAERKY